MSGWERLRQWMAMWIMWMLATTAIKTVLWPDDRSIASHLAAGAVSGMLWATMMMWWNSRNADPSASDPTDTDRELT